MNTGPYAGGKTRWYFLRLKTSGRCSQNERERLQTFQEVPKLTRKEREEIRTRRQEAFNEKMTKKQEKEAKMKREKEENANYMSWLNVPQTDWRNLR